MSSGNNGKVLTFSRKLTKIFTLAVKAITPLRPSSYVRYKPDVRDLISLDVQIGKTALHKPVKKATIQII